MSDHKSSSIGLNLYLFPEDFIIEILSLWITTTELGRLDSAMCSHRKKRMSSIDRDWFLRVIQSNNFTTPGMLLKGCTSAFKTWCQRRSVKIRALHLDSATIIDNLSESITHCYHSCSDGELNGNNVVVKKWNLSRLESLSFVGSYDVNKYKLVQLLKECSSLQSFSVTGVAAWLTPYIVRKLLRLCPFLRVISFRGCEHITRAAVQHICTMTNHCLEELTLSRCPISLDGVRDLTAAANRTAAGGTALDFKSFPVLCIRGNKNAISPQNSHHDTIKHTYTGRHVTKRKSLKPSSSNGVAAALGTGTFSNLKHLDLSFCREVTTCALSDVISSLINATKVRYGNSSKSARFCSINLSGCGSVSCGDFIIHCASICTSNLTALNLSSCRGVTDNALNILSSNCSELRCIDISLIKGISESSLLNLVNRCTLLHTIHMGSTDGVTDAVVESFMTSCRFLKSIDISDSPLITDRALFLIAGQGDDGGFSDGSHQAKRKADFESKKYKKAMQPLLIGVRHLPPVESVNVRNCYHVQDSEAVLTLVEAYGDSGTGTLELIDIRNTRIVTKQLLDRLPPYQRFEILYN